MHFSKHTVPNILRSVEARIWDIFSPVEDASSESPPVFPVVVYSRRLGKFFFDVEVQLWRRMTNRVPHVSLWRAPKCPDFYDTPGYSSIVPSAACPIPPRYGVRKETSVPSTFALRAFTWGLIFVW